jgi:hypothetical protein
MIDWLAERLGGGDAIAQHGFQHLQLRRGSLPRQLLVGRPSRYAAEFVGLDEGETRRAVEAGRRVLKLAGIEPAGFVAPAYAYTPALRETLAARFRWWAGLLRLHRALGPAPAGCDGQRDGGNGGLLAPAWSLGTSGPARRMLSPSLLRAGALMSGQTLRH